MIAIRTRRRKKMTVRPWSESTSYRRSKISGELFLPPSKPPILISIVRFGSDPWHNVVPQWMIIQFPSIGHKNVPRIAISIEADALG
jgi:hypothetical protein